MKQLHYGMICFRSGGQTVSGQVDKLFLVSGHLVGFDVNCDCLRKHYFIARK